MSATPVGRLKAWVAWRLKRPRITYCGRYEYDSTRSGRGEACAIPECPWYQTTQLSSLTRGICLAEEEHKSRLSLWKLLKP